MAAAKIPYQLNNAQGQTDNNTKECSNLAT